MDTFSIIMVNDKQFFHVTVYSEFVYQHSYYLLPLLTMGNQNEFCCKEEEKEGEAKWKWDLHATDRH